MSQWLVRILLLSLLLSTALGRSLKGAEPALNIQFPGGSVTGGNGSPLKVVFPGGDVFVGQKFEGCGKGTLVDVNHPAGHTGVWTRSGCKQTNVNVQAPSTSVAVEKSG
jgi:hypothetical protein